MDVLPIACSSQLFHGSYPKSYRAIPRAIRVPHILQSTALKTEPCAMVVVTTASTFTAVLTLASVKMPKPPRGRRVVGIIQRQARKASKEQENKSSTVTLQVPQDLIGQLPAAIRDNEERRERYLTEALEIGVRAFAQAGISLDTSLVQTSFATMLSDLKLHTESSERSLKDLLNSQVSGEDSQLARLLLDQFGERGRLASLLDDICRRLADPGVKASLPNTVSELVSNALEDERAEIGKLVNAADPKSPLGLFLAQQQEAVRAFQGEYIQKITDIEQKLSQDMSEIRIALDVDKRLQAMNAEMEELRDKSTSKGMTFEEAGYEVLTQIARGFGDRVESCGTEVVDGTNRKIGDQLIYICQPGLPELAIIVEQKAGKISRKPLLRQMQEAIEFRSASAAIGLMQRRYLGKTQPVYDQHGPVQVIVGVDWLGDGEVKQADWFPLQVAYRAIRSQLIASKLQQSGSTIDVDELRARIKSVEQALGDAQRVKVNATAARTNLDSITSTIKDMENRIRNELAAMELALNNSNL
eukprot:TRINITY_DN11776_c1_g1_i1.p1 TRINITY_DN11776_c1_g1~~TRINITY_DN11776_c1_g1_i1.p1  ORF type:complete len:529 (-),score=83.26 TRINITY_DN11776_c1_g1_i1:45-1631(-)